MEKNVKNARVMILFSVLLLIFILIFAAIFALSNQNNGQNAKKYDFIFHEVDFETDILSDESYLSLNRSVSLKQGNQTTVIDRNYVSEKGTVEFMLDYLDCVISGDYEGYGDFFSELYFEAESVPEIFTMQRIYEITVEILSETEIADSNRNYTEYRISLDYKINRNDGTFRQDMGSDCIRTQYFLITDREGDLKIDTVKSFDVVEEIPSGEALKISALNLVCVIILILLSAVLIVTTVKFKKKCIDKKRFVRIAFVTFAGIAVDLVIIALGSLI